MFEIIREKEKWDSIVEECDLVDFYHTYSYHELSKKEREIPVLFSFRDDDVVIAIPLLFRSIKGTSYKDATSVYGYSGPISNNVPDNYDYTLFQNELNSFFNDESIVSVFSRLNPFISHQEKSLLGLGKIETLGKVVYLDLNQTLDEQLSSYNRRLKTYINKSRNVYTIKLAYSETDIESFKMLYHENMKRVDANEEYFFDSHYFIDFINCAKFETDLLLAIDNETGDVAGGAMFTKKNSFVQYHLSGTLDKYLSLNPVKLLIDEMRIKGSEQGYKFLNLGGGVGSKEDSLFYFKSGFSKETMPFKVWKYMVNPKIYKELVHERTDVHQSNELVQYFPHYRYIKE